MTLLQLLMNECMECITSYLLHAVSNIVAKCKCLGSITAELQTLASAQKVYTGHFMLWFSMSEHVVYIYVAQY